MLKTETVGPYTVSQMSALHSARLRLHQRNLAADAKLTEEESEAGSEWAFLAACCDPFIPFREYLNMPLTETRPLLEAAERLNADIVDNPKKS